MANCPCCNAPLATDGRVLIDEDGGSIVANGAVARLPETQFNLFMILWRQSPRVMTKAALMDASYWRRSDAEIPDEKIIDVWICKIRRQLAPLGVEIDTVWGRGYRILRKGEAE